MTNDTFLTKLRAAIERNGGRPPGQRAFYKATGLTMDALWQAGYESYGAACKAAGFEPNTLQRRLSDEEVLRPLALFARQLGRFPTKGALEVQRKRDPSFPSWEAFKRRERQGPEASLRETLAAWCRSTTEFADVAQLLGAATPSSAKRTPGRPVISGHVYLMRYGTGGSVYKVGRTDNVLRRHAQLSTMAPQDLRVIHTIATDDPQGIERYWLGRFEPKRLEGKTELFRLTPDDIAAFKSRKYQ